MVFWHLGLLLLLLLHGYAGGRGDGQCELKEGSQIALFLSLYAAEAEVERVERVGRHAGGQGCHFFLLAGWLAGWL